MITLFPGAIDDSSTLPNVAGGTLSTAPSHAGLHVNTQDAIKALEAKVGITTSPVTSSLDYKVRILQTNSATLTGAENLSNKTIITPTIASFVNANHNHQNSAGGGRLAESALLLTDITTNNVSTTAHGFVPKAPNDTDRFLRGDATWSVSPYTVFITMGQSTNLNATTYYNATAYSNDQIEGHTRIYLPRGGTITAIYLWVGNAGTAGTNEVSSIYLRQNATTDILLTSAFVTNVKPGTSYPLTGLSIAVADGDFIQLKWITPTWATPPTTLSISAMVYIS